MKIFNDWELRKILPRTSIKNFEYLKDNELIEEIEDGYYYLKSSIYDIEKKYYDEANNKLLDELNLTDTKKELKEIIKKLHKYNESKDIAESLMGKIADLRGVAIKEIHQDMGVYSEDDQYDHK